MNGPSIRRVCGLPVMSYDGALTIDWSTLSLKQPRKDAIFCSIGSWGPLDRSWSSDNILESLVKEDSEARFWVKRKLCTL